MANATKTKSRLELETVDAIEAAADVQAAEKVYASGPRTRRTWRALQDAHRRITR